MKELAEFFSSRRPKELQENVFRALAIRWGFHDGQVYQLRQVAKTRKAALQELYEAEISMVERLGWRIKKTKDTERRWKAM